MSNLKSILAVLLSASMIVCSLTLTALADATAEETGSGDTTATETDPSDETTANIAESIKFDKTDYILKIGTSVKADVIATPDGTSLPNDLIFSATSKNVVTISEDGMINAIGPGKANIMVISKSNSSLSAVSTVTVIANVEYKISDIPGSSEKLIGGFELGVSVKNAKDGLKSFFANDSVSVTNSDGTEAKDIDAISTGMNISVDGANYKVVIKGDVSGDGKITYDDTRVLIKYLSGESSYPNSAFVEAATIDGSYSEGDEPTLECALKISRHVLKKYIINQ